MEILFIIYLLVYAALVFEGIDRFGGEFKFLEYFLMFTVLIFWPIIIIVSYLDNKNKKEEKTENDLS